MLMGSRVTLRAARPADLPLLASLRNDPELQRRLMSLPRPNSTVKVQDWLNRRAGEPDTLFFVLAEGEDAVGFIQLTGLDTVHGTADLGVCLAPAAQGRGLGGEAVTLLETYAQEVFGLRKVCLRVLGDNAGAIALYRKLGYREVGVLREHFYHGGAYHDVTIMEHLLA